MGESNEARSRAIQNFSLQIEKYPRDLLQRFISSTGQESEYSNPNQDSEEIEIELNLGLSLGGRFGIDKNAKKKLIRSSSVINPPPASYSNLVRTSSLPSETEDEWRKRKEFQMLRRMEAKRRRSEKQRNSNANLKVLEEERREIGLNSTAPLRPLVVASWAVLGRVNSQGSVESQGGCSSGMSELESKAVQGSSSCGEARSPASNQSLQERSNQEEVGSSGTKTCENACRTSRDQAMENPSKKPDSAPQKGKEIGANALEDMPGVFTKGDGPNGRRIEGILYKYGKGEDVRIMCVCHGSFLSPAEFVKHAGGSDVANPLKHIVVNPSSTSFL